jgi:hypothetical protein
MRSIKNYVAIQKPISVSRKHTFDCFPLPYCFQISKKKSIWLMRKEFSKWKFSLSFLMAYRKVMPSDSRFKVDGYLWLLDFGVTGFHLMGGNAA